MRKAAIRLATCSALALAACSKGTPAPPAAPEPPAPPPVAFIDFVEGADQSAPTGTAVPVDPAVRLADAERRPIAGVRVTFTVEGGQGAAVSPAESSTGADGVARTHFTLGTAPGPYFLQAQAGGATLRTVALAIGPIAALERQSGEFQMAAPGAAVAEPPRVRAVDLLGNPIPGQQVACTVEQGGGAVAAATVAADARGVATCAWTLGTVRGVEDVLAVSAGGLVLRFRAGAGLRSADFTVRFVPPPRFEFPAPQPDRSLFANVTSTFQLRSVTASAGALSLPMAFAPGFSLWTAVLPGAGLARGLHFVRVVAVDANGAEADDYAWVTVDHPPVLSVQEPIDGALARPTIAFSATCADDDPAGCASLAVYRSRFASPDGLPIASGQASVSGTVDLGSDEGGSTFLVFQARDSAGLFRTEARQVFVDTTPGLSLVATVAGAVLDADATRVLHRTDVDGVAVTVRATGAATRIGTAVSPGPGYLTARGALFTQIPAVSLPRPPGSLLEWTGSGSAVELAQVDPFVPPLHAGGFALWAVPGELALVRRDLAAGAEVRLAAASGSLSASGGDVAFIKSDRNAYLFRAGQERQLTALDPLAQVQAAGPVTDGGRAAYRLLSAQAPSAPTLVVWDGSEQTEGTVVCPTEPCYLLTGPWLAYHLPDPLTGVPHVWRRGIGGLAQAGFLAAGESLELLLPDGTVVFRSAGRRWRAAPGGAARDAGTAAGRAEFRDGRVLVLVGPSVLELAP